MPGASGGSSSRRFVAIVGALPALLALCVPQAHGQDSSWDGSVEVSTQAIEISEGKAVTYSVRLSEPPTADNWWIVLRVDGGMRDEGSYGGITWLPSVGWEFDQDNWDQWRQITISWDDDYDEETLGPRLDQITFEHEVWDHDSNCPFKGSPLTVRVSGDSRRNIPPNTPLPTLAIADAEVEEGGAADFRVTLSGARTGRVTVAYSTADGTADAGDDYTGTSGTLTFETNESSRTISVPTREDTTAEETETFTVTLSDPAGATIDDGSATGTITDDDGDDDGDPSTTLPTLSVGDATVEEGETAEFTVTLTGTRTGGVTVAYATADGTADAGDDYSPRSGTLTFGPNESSKTISVPTREDTTEEEAETFTVTLGSPAGATIEDGSATGTITDDDGDDDGDPTTTLPTLSIADATVEEGETAEFTVTLTGTRAGLVTVAYSTADGTADAGDDYTSRSGTLTFGPNENSKTISVPTREDTTEEEAETFTVTLGSPAGATLDDGSATGTITDDDDDGGNPTTTLPTLSIGDATVEEGETAEFTVTLTGTRTGLVTVAYSTADGTADGGATTPALRET